MAEAPVAGPPPYDPCHEERSVIGKSKQKLRSRILAGALLASLASSPAMAVVCASPSEEAALRARVVQSQLMVAALSCSQRSGYNAFVRKFERQLVRQGQALRFFFKRTYGKSAKDRLNRFVTSLANEASERSLGMGTQFCAEAAKLFVELKEISPREFQAFVARQQFAGAHGIEACPAQGRLDLAD
jgi:hypothetical protein